MSMIAVVFYAFHVSSQNERWSGMDDFTHRPVAPRTSVLLFCLSLESGRHMPLLAFSEGSVVHSCCNTLPPCLPAFQQQHTNQHYNVRDLNYSPALTYLQGVWELGVEQISLKMQPCVIATTLKQACRVPSHSHFPLPFFSVYFSSRVVSCGPRGCDDGERSWLAWALPRSLWADCVSSERQIDVFPPCAHTLSQSCISIGTNTHACTRLASWQMYTHSG